MTDSSVILTKDVPIVMRKDVVVIGGGPTGVTAAIAAARAGANTLLIEQHGWLGGQINQDMYFIGFLDSKGRQIIKGIPDEIIKRLIKIKASPGHIPDDYEASITPVDARMYNIVALQMLKEANADVLFHSFFSDVIMKGDKTIQYAIVANKSGHQAIEGKVFIDATGDADVAGRAGAPFSKGRKEDGKMMPMLLWLTFYNVDWEKFRDALINNPDLYDTDPDTPGIRGEGMLPEYFQKVRYITFWGFRNLVKKAVEKGYRPGSSRIGVGHSSRLDQGMYCTLKFDGVDGTNAQDVSKAEVELRLMIPDAIRFIKDCLPGWENAVFMHASPILGVQESRVIVGEYTLTKEDIIGSSRFQDVIAVGGAKIDDWDTFRMVYPEDNYDVPYRCLVPQKIENLLVAGRPISATRDAMMSVRCMSMCAATGQAAGVSAALCSKLQIPTLMLDYYLLRKTLLEQGAYLGEKR